jgi:hypothetical protein
MANLNTPSSPSNAKIVKQGHTTSGRHGDNPDMQVKGKTSVRDLGIKGK